MQEKIKQLRLGIDGIAQLTKDLTGYKFGDGKQEGKSYQVIDAEQSLYMAKAWLGKVMGELGVESPYKSGYKTKEDIEPTADVAPKGTFADYLTLTNHIEKVDYLRTQIESLVKEVKELDLNLEVRLSREFAIARTNAYNYLCEARFHLGFELQRIKKA